jgi:hypothetical protein
MLVSASTRSVSPNQVASFRPIVLVKAFRCFAANHSVRFSSIFNEKDYGQVRRFKDVELG